MSISCETDLGDLMRVGNHEAKAIVLGGMQPGMTYGGTAQYQELFLKPQGKHPEYPATLSNAIGYCALSLEPAGCVERALTEDIQYTVTSLGEREGKALAGHVLALSLEAGDDIGLQSLYGVAQTSAGKESRPSMDRLGLFRMLVAEDSVQAIDVQTKLDLDANTAVANLVWLDEHGVIEYQAIDGREIDQHIIYGLPGELRLNGEASNKEGSMPRVIQDTVRHLIADGVTEVSQANFMDVLRERYPDLEMERPNRRKYAQRIMNELAAAGRITKGPFSGRHKSSATLLDSARPAVAQAVAIADGMLSGDTAFLREGRQRLRDILSNEEQVRILIGKAFRESPSANGIKRQERVDHVTAALTEGAASSKELIDLLKNHGMTKISTKRTLEMMRSEGLVASETIPGGRELSWELITDDVAA